MLQWTWERDFARRFRFLWCDRRGCYRSGRTAGGYSLENQARGDLAGYLDEVQELVARAQSVPHAERVAWYAVELRTMQAYMERDLTDLAARVTCPTLVLHGSDDRMAPWHGVSVWPRRFQQHNHASSPADMVWCTGLRKVAASPSSTLSSRKPGVGCRGDVARRWPAEYQMKYGLDVATVGSMPTQGNSQSLPSKLKTPAGMGSSSEMLLRRSIGTCYSRRMSRRRCIVSPVGQAF